MPLYFGGSRCPSREVAITVCNMFGRGKNVVTCGSRVVMNLQTCSPSALSLPFGLQDMLPLASEYAELLGAGACAAPAAAGCKKPGTLRISMHAIPRRS